MGRRLTPRPYVPAHKAPLVRAATRDVNSLYYLGFKTRNRPYGVIVEALVCAEVRWEEEERERERERYGRCRCGGQEDREGEILRMEELEGRKEGKGRNIEEGRDMENERGGREKYIVVVGGGGKGEMWRCGREGEKQGEMFVGEGRKGAEGREKLVTGAEI